MRYLRIHLAARGAVTPADATAAEDCTRVLAEHTRQRHHHALQRAQQTLTELTNAGDQVTDALLADRVVLSLTVSGGQSVRTETTTVRGKQSFLLNNDT
jgi:hypothetical protein